MINYPEIYSAHDLKFKVLFTPEDIDHKIDLIAKQLNEDYRGKTVTLLVTLKGAIMFASDLMRKLDFDIEIQTIRAKSYGNAMSSKGSVDLIYPELDIKNKEVLIIEDIVDSGLTLQTLCNTLSTMHPKSLETVALLSKPEMLKINVRLKYCVMEVPPLFVVGYGLDYAEKGRQLPAIYALEE